MNGAQQAQTSTYRVLRQLGARVDNTHVAVRGAHDLVVVQRFPRSAEAILREARCLAKNWHPNVARVRYVDVIGNEVLVATELVEGVTLADLTAAASSKQKTLPPAVMMRIVLDVLGGLQSIHGMRDEANAPLGAFHGAVCPTNIVVGKDGVARLVAPFRQRPVRATAKSEWLCYSPPESVEERGAADPRSDLYACGVILWEGLQGKPLFAGKTQPSEILHEQREEETAWVADPGSMVARLGAVVLRALAFEPALRIRSAGELATAVRRAAAADIATGSRVAQTVVELAGERIRARRADLDQRVNGRELAAVKSPPAPRDQPPIEPPPPTVKNPQTPQAPPTPPKSDPVIKVAAAAAAPPPTAPKPKPVTIVKTAAPAAAAPPAKPLLVKLPPPAPTKPEPVPAASLFAPPAPPKKEEDVVPQQTKEEAEEAKEDTLAEVKAPIVATLVSPPPSPARNKPPATPIPIAAIVAASVAAARTPAPIAEPAVAPTPLQHQSSAGNYASINQADVDVNPIEADSRTSILQKGVPLRVAVLIVAATFVITLLVILVLVRFRGDARLHNTQATTSTTTAVRPSTTTAPSNEKPTTAAEAPTTTTQDDDNGSNPTPGTNMGNGAGATETSGSAAAPPFDPSAAVPEPTTSAAPARPPTRKPYEPLGI